MRVVLVPATMDLLGKANWWLPERLGRFLPRVAVDGPAPVHAIGAHASPEEKAVA